MSILTSVRKSMSGVLAWSFLRGIQSYKIVKSTYIWLFILPIITKAFSQIEDTLRMDFYGQNIVLDLELPFAWIMLFYSALLFTIGNLIFLIACPAIIKENRSLADFKTTMKTPTHLLSYMTESQKGEWEEEKDMFGMGVGRLVGEGIPRDSIARKKADMLDAQFWHIYNQQNICRLPVRITVLTIYVVAAYCFSSVLYQNVYYVFTQS